jgi:hypothetical protein
MALSAVASTFGQGTIDFINRNISTKEDPSVLYNVPIFSMNGRATGEGAGNLPGGVTVGLFLAGSDLNASPLISTTLRTGTPLQAQFFAVSPQTAIIPGVPAGYKANLIVRAWGGPSYADAVLNFGIRGEWAFTSEPLGGTPPGGGLPVPTPGMTGWGPEDGSGLTVVEGFIPEPTTLSLAVIGVGILSLLNRKERT